MKTKIIFLFITLLLSFNFSSPAQIKKETTSVKVDIQPDSTITNFTKPQKSVTQGSVTVEGKRINYQAIAGTLILKNKDEKPTCSMFYTAYFKSDESDESQRPVTFIYSGGPGSSSLLLHVGAWGPRIAYSTDTARTIAPYKMINNDNSLLDASDLIFIDPPGAGFSQIITKENGGAGEPEDFYGIDPDAHAFAQFITRFLSTYNRWNSPKYLFGVSYGTLRSAVLSNILETEDAVDLNGVILLSQILSYNNMSDISGMDPGSDIRYELALPSGAATAWYHHKIPDQPEKLEPFLKEVEDFALGEYATAMTKGSLLDATTFDHIADKIHQYTGLPVAYIKKANLRISGPMFEKMLLASDNKITGRLDTRFSGWDMDPLSETPGYDPYIATFIATFVGTFNTYVRTELKFGKGVTFYPSNHSLFPQWDFRHLVPNARIKKAFFANVMPDLASAMIYNPKLKVMLNTDYFDLATPYFEGLYEMHHLPIPAELQKNISFEFYYSGHFSYLNPVAHKQLHDNVAKFINDTH